jgi:hypothetical protein
LGGKSAGDDRRFNGSDVWVEVLGLRAVVLADLTVLDLPRFVADARFGLGKAPSQFGKWKKQYHHETGIGELARRNKQQ